MGRRLNIPVTPAMIDIANELATKIETATVQEVKTVMYCDGVEHFRIYARRKHRRLFAGGCYQSVLTGGAEVTAVLRRAHYGGSLKNFQKEITLRKGWSIYDFKIAVHQACHWAESAYQRMVESENLWQLMFTLNARDGFRIAAVAKEAEFGALPPFDEMTLDQVRTWSKWVTDWSEENPFRG